MLTVFGHLGFEVFVFSNYKTTVIPGGGAFGVLTGATGVNEEVRIIASAGISAYDFFANCFCNKNIDYSWLKSDGKIPCSFYYDFRDENISKDDALKSVFTPQESNEYLCDAAMRCPIKDTRFHICAIPIEDQLRIINNLMDRGVQKRNISLSMFHALLRVDGAKDILFELSNSIGLLCMNLYEWKMVYPILSSRADKIPLTLISNREAPVTLRREDGSTIEGTVPQVKAINTVGAGDVLHGAFTAIFNSTKAEEALLKAVTLAAKSTNDIGILHIL